MENPERPVTLATRQRRKLPHDYEDSSAIWHTGGEKDSNQSV